MHGSATARRATSQATKALPPEPHLFNAITGRRDELGSTVDVVHQGVSLCHFLHRLSQMSVE